MKILYVYGEDYAALSFDNLVEATVLTAEELWVKARQTGVTRYEDGNDVFEYQALEFGDVDRHFIDWVQAEQDYDESKHSRFYVVDE